MPGTRRLAQEGGGERDFRKPITETRAQESSVRSYQGALETHPPTIDGGCCDPEARPACPLTPPTL